MADREVKFKLGWFNVFNLGGALYGWMHGHTWTDAAIGYLIGSIGPPLAIMGVLVFVLGVCKFADALPAPKVRIADDVVTEDPEKRWEQEYAKHCLDNNLPNELRTCVKQDLYYAEAESISRNTTSGGGPG